MRILLLIGTGGFIGSILRYSFSQFIHTKILSAFPYGTLSVNITGCLAIGLVLALAERGTLTTDWRLFLATGICGGFTTFSAFSAETLFLLRNDRPLEAFSYIGASMLLGLAATYIGFIIVRLLSGSPQ